MLINDLTLANEIDQNKSVLDQLGYYTIRK